MGGISIRSNRCLNQRWIGLSGSKISIFKLITTKNKKLEKYSSRHFFVIKLCNTLSLFLDFSCNTGTQKAPFLLFFWVICCPLLLAKLRPVSVCGCQMSHLQPRMNPPVLPPLPVRRSRQFLNANYDSVAPKGEAKLCDDNDDR